MDADVLLLAAGLGTRLRPLTATEPKPMIRVGGRPLIDRNLELIARNGFRRVFINLHHLGEQIRDYVRSGERWGISIEYSEEPILLDTGGAIKQIEHRLLHPALLLMNSDIAVGEDFSLREVVQSHFSRSSAVTLVLRRDPAAQRFGEVVLNREHRVVEFLGKSYGETGVERSLMYLGVMAISRPVISSMPPAGSIFSVTRNTIVELLERGEILHGTMYGGYWNDVGTPERLEQVRRVYRES